MNLPQKECLENGASENKEPKEISSIKWNLGRLSKEIKKKKRKRTTLWKKRACEHTEHANLAWQAAGGQGRFSVVVVRADVVPQVGGATGHPKSGGIEEARAERACVRRRRRSQGLGVKVCRMEGAEVRRVN